MSSVLCSIGGSSQNALHSGDKPIHVVTLSPFYPSQAHPVRGCFIAEPLRYLEQHRVGGEVIAAQPVHKGYARPLPSNMATTWQHYFCAPGNLGLASAGTFLAKELVPRLSRRAGEIDLIHAHAALPCGHAAMILSARLGIPYVVSVHGLDVFSDVQVKGSMGARCRSVSTQVYGRARAVICISDRVRQAIDGQAAARTTVVYNGVDEELFRPGSESTPAVVLTVGNLIPIKGHARVIKAFAMIAAEFREAVLEIIGEGPEEGKLRALAAELGLAARVRFLGRQPREQVAAAMRRCAVFALPSSYEGLGCVYLEAMASAKPVIACRGQGIEEIVVDGRNGYLISPESVRELAEQMGRLLLDQQLRARIGDTARATVLANYTLSHQAARLAEVYRESLR